MTTLRLYDRELPLNDERPLGEFRQAESARRDRVVSGATRNGDVRTGDFGEAGRPPGLGDFRQPRHFEDCPQEAGLQGLVAVDGHRDDKPLAGFGVDVVAALDAP